MSLKVEEKANIMNKIMVILTVLLGGILVIGGFGAAALTKDYENHPPEAPKITGPWHIRPGTHEWTFKAIDPNGDDVSYEIDWGDNMVEKWIGPYVSGDEITRNHTYYYLGTVHIQARAKDTHGAIGDWGYMQVEISKSKQMTNLLTIRFLERFIDRFLMIK